MKLFMQGATLVNRGWPSTRLGVRPAAFGFEGVVAGDEGVAVETDHAEIEAVEGLVAHGCQLLAEIGLGEVQLRWWPMLLASLRRLLKNML